MTLFWGGVSRHWKLRELVNTLHMFPSVGVTFGISNTDSNLTTWQPNDAQDFFPGPVWLNAVSVHVIKRCIVKSEDTFSHQLGKHSLSVPKNGDINMLSYTSREPRVHVLAGTNVNPLSHPVSSYLSDKAPQSNTHAQSTQRTLTVPRLMHF